jgi:hypothetical protein
VRLSKFKVKNAGDKKVEERPLQTKNLFALLKRMLNLVLSMFELSVTNQQLYYSSKHFIWSYELNNRK